MFTILASLARRNFFLIAVMFPLLIACWIMALVSPGDVVAGTHYDLPYLPAFILWGFALAAGTRAVHEKLVFVLPLSRRELGRTAWTAAVVCPAALVAAAKVPAWFLAGLATTTPNAGVGWLAFSTLFDIACGGTIVFLLTVVPGQASGVLKVAANVAWAVGLFATPVFASIATPIGLSQAGTRQWIWLVAGLAMTAVGFIRAERLALISGAISARSRAVPSRKSMSRQRVVRFGPIGGRTRPIAKYLSQQMAIAGATALAALLILTVAHYFVFTGTSPRGFPASMRGVLRLDKDGGMDSLLFLAALFGPYSTGLSPWHNPKWLRVLPLSGHDVRNVMLARVAACSIGYWGALIVACLALLGAVPLWVGPGLIGAMTGLSALSGAVGFGASQGKLFPWLPALVGLLLPVMSRVAPHFIGSTMATAAGLTVGFVGLGVGTLVFDRKIRRSQKIYKPRASPFRRAA